MLVLGFEKDDRPSLHDCLSGSFQLRQDVSLLRNQMCHLVIYKEFAAFRAISEQQDQQLERRLRSIETREDQVNEKFEKYKY